MTYLKESGVVLKSEASTYNNEWEKNLETSYTAELRNDAQLFYLVYKSTMTIS